MLMFQYFHFQYFMVYQELNNELWNGYELMAILCGSVTQNVISVILGQWNKNRQSGHALQEVEGANSS